MSKLSDVTVIDIGSKSICAYRAEKLSDENFAVKNSFEMDYSGYMDGEWLRPDELFPTFSKLLERIETAGGKTKELFVGIPSQFATLRTVPARVVFPKPKRVTAADVEELYSYNNPFEAEEYICLSVLPVFFQTDNGEKTNDPVGRVTGSLKCRLSYVGAETDTISFIRQALSRCGIREVRFVQSEIASAMALFGEEERDAGILFCDIGYLATTVLFLSGEGVLEMKNFSLGGGMIPAGLSEALDLPFAAAEALTAKVNLGYKDEGDYSFRFDGAEYSFPVREVNEMVKECIQCVATFITKAIHSFRFELSPYVPTFLSGGGFYEIRGAREYLSRYLSRNADYALPLVPNYNKPYYATAVGLIKEALKKQKEDRFGFIKRLLGK